MVSQAYKISVNIPFNKVIFNLTRLDIIGSLDDMQPIPFTELRDVLELTSGNLASHLRVLEKHDIISVTKTFRGKKPYTLISLTINGEENFKTLKEWFYQVFLEGN